MMELNKRSKQKEDLKGSYSELNVFEELDKTSISMKEASREFPPLESTLRNSTLKKLKTKTSEQPVFNELNPILQYTSLKTDYSNDFWLTGNGQKLKIGEMHFSHLVNARNFIFDWAEREDLNVTHLGVSLRWWGRILTHEIQRRIVPVMNNLGSSLPATWVSIPNFTIKSSPCTETLQLPNALVSATPSQLEDILNNKSEKTENNLTRYLFVYRRDRDQVLAFTKALLTLHKEKVSNYKKDDSVKIESLNVVETGPKQLSLF